MGKTKVPIDPQRVVILDGGWDTVLSLGVKPIGSVQIYPSGSYLKNRLEGIESAGHRDNPDLESIVALKPDLILGTRNDRDIYKLLSQIAPTVLTEVETSGDSLLPRIFISIFAGIIVDRANRKYLMMLY